MGKRGTRARHQLKDLQIEDVCKAEKDYIKALGDMEMKLL